MSHGTNSYQHLQSHVLQEAEAEEEGDEDLLLPLDVVVGETEIDAFS